MATFRLVRVARRVLPRGVEFVRYGRARLGKYDRSAYRRALKPLAAWPETVLQKYLEYRQFLRQMSAVRRSTINKYAILTASRELIV